MKKLLIGASALTICATAAVAGGIERSTNDYGLLFQSGTQFSLTHSYVNPSVSGEYRAALGGGETGNMAGDYGTFGFAYKNDFSDKLAFGLYHNQAYGANAEYRQGFYNGLTAKWKSKQTAAILKYRLGDRVSVYGGLRYVFSSADITIPDQMIRASTVRSAVGTQSQLQAAVTQLQNAGVPASDPTLQTYQAQLAQATAFATAAATAPQGAFEYNAAGDQRGDWGYVLGAAYEIPDIALRVALTWESKVTHKFDTAESLPFFAALVPASTTTEIEMPQSVALDLQTGIAPGTLLFGGVKWTEWSKWEVRTPGYENVTGEEVTGFDNDTLTWKLGLAKQFNDTYAAFAQITYEKSNGGVTSRLSPTDGRTSLALGGRFTDGPHQLRMGVEYVKLGDATDASGTRFEGNSAIGVGLSYTTSF